MGLHSARRSPSGVSTFAGRGLFTAAAALTLLGGGTGIALAGDATTDSGSHSSDDNGGHGHGDHRGHHKGSWGDKHGKCRIPTVDDADDHVTKILDDETHGEYSTLGEPVKPTEDEVHDAVCPPAKEILDTVGHEEDSAPEHHAPSMTDAPSTKDAPSAPHMSTMAPRG